MTYTKTVWAVGTTGTATMMNNIESGIEANDAAIAGKAPTSHTHTAGQVVDFPAAVRGEVATFVVAGSGITKAYDETAGTLTLSAATAATDPEVVRDTISTALIAGANISISKDDPADTITISVTGLDTALRNTDATIRYTTTVPLRSTVTTDTARRAVWVGQVEPPKTTGYALPGDIFESTV